MIFWNIETLKRWFCSGLIAGNVMMSEGLITKGLAWSVWLLTSVVCVGNAALSRHDAQLFAFRLPFRTTGLMPMQVPGEAGIGVAVPVLSVCIIEPDVGRSISVPVKPVGGSF